MNKEKALNDEWRILKFSECIQQLNTGLNPRKNFSLGKGEIKYITAKNLTKSGTIDFSKCDFIDEEAKKIINKRSDIKVGDILFSSRAPIGQCHLIKEEPDYFDIGESIFSIRVNQEIVLPEYLCLYLSSDHFIKIASKNTTGSIISEIRVGDLMDISVIVPPKHVQKNIANCISTIDRKIGNNNAINAELESMARTIYDYWFLQFEFPNEEGKPYKSSGGKMVWNEELKREIPEGWKIDEISSYIDFISGYPFSSEDYVDDGEYKLYTIKNVQDGEIISNVDNCLNQLPENLPQECCLKAGDLIMSLTGNVGRVGLVYENNALLNQRVLKLVSKGGHIAYIYLLFRNNTTKTILETIATGTSQKNLSPINMGKIKTLVPSDFILEKFDAICNEMIEKIVANYIENQELAALRDFLLPLLMNGQVGFKEKDGEE